MTNEINFKIPTTKCKTSTIQLLFNPKISEYNLFYSHKSESLVSTYLNKDLINNEALISIIKRFENIKFVGLNSLIDFCKIEKLNNLQVVFEWINFFIYREERKNFDLYRPENDLIMGISNLIEIIKSDHEEQYNTNGFKYYVSNIRTLLTKSLLQLINTSEVLNGNSDFDSFINRLMMNIFSLNFEEAGKIIKEAILGKDRKIPNEVMPFLMIFQEVIIHLTSSSNSSYFSLIDTVKNFISNFDKIDLTPNLSYLNLFIQQKFNQKLNEFFNSKDISLLIKLFFLLKHDNKQDLLIHLEILENYYTDFGLLEGLILTGSSNKSIELLQNYLNRSDDLLVSVILSKFFVNSKEKFYTKCESDLDEILNRMKMFNERIHLNQKLNEIVSHLEKGFKTSFVAGEKKTNSLISNFNSTELVLSCFYCNAKINADRADQFRNLFANNKDGNENIDFCPKCIKKLPNCAICLCSIEINIPMPKSKTGHHNSETKREKVEIEEIRPDLKYIWCTKCRHGGHLDHIREWFGDLLICPVADCSCICLEYNHIIV